MAKRETNWLVSAPIVAAAYGFVVWDRLKTDPAAFQGFGFHPEAIAQMPAGLRWHLLGAVAAILLGALQMVRRKGGAAHRVLGAVWAVLMIVMSLAAMIGSPTVGVLQILAVVVILLTARAVWLAHRHDVVGHKHQMQMLFFAALLGVGLFTAVPGRATWKLFFSGSGAGVAAPAAAAP